MVCDYFLKKERKIHEFPTYDLENGIAVQSTTFSPIFTSGFRVYALPEFLDVEDIEASYEIYKQLLHIYVVCASVFLRTDMCCFYFLVINLNIL